MQRAMLDHINKDETTMPLHIQQHENEGIVILALIGRLSMGPEDITFRNTLDTCIAAGKLKIILDCAKLRDLDSVGVGTLVAYNIKIGTAGGKLALVHMSQTHTELLALAKLEGAFEVFKNEPDAVNSFFPDRAIQQYDVLEFVEQETQMERRAEPTSEEPSKS